MRSVCAWCGVVMGEKPPLEDKRRTHGICPKCEKELEKQQENKATGPADNHGCAEAEV